MKIVIDSDIPFLDGRLPEDLELLKMPGKEITREILRDADAVVVRTRTKCDSRLLKDTAIRLVVTATIGRDHIDEGWCEKNGITVKSAPGCNAPGVAQYVLASLLEAGFNPKCHTLGIIGYGNVGSIVALWAQEMGIKTMVCDPPRLEQGFRDIEYVSLEKILQQSDAITLHVPLTEKGKYHTRRLIGKRELEMMKKRAILINSSRGGVVDEAALKDKIITNELKAVIDVWENEPEIDRKLSELAFIATPHIAGYSEEGKKRASGIALESLKEVLGIKVDTEGLKCEAEITEKITPELILRSYSPIKDSLRFKTDTGNFEQQRNNYSYRHEPLFLEPSSINM